MSDTIDDLTETVEDTLQKIDFGDLSKASVFGGENFIDTVGQILSGAFFEKYPDIISGIWGLVGGAVIAVLPIVVLITAITILCGFVDAMKTDGHGVAGIIYFVSYSAVVLITVGSVVDLVSTVGSTLNAVKTQIDIVFPIILTLMVAGGGSASAGVYQPAVLVLSSGIMQIFTLVVMPLFVVSFAFAVVSNISPNAKLDRFVGFFNSCFRWVVGVCFTVFFAFMTVQGITAGSFDGVTARAAKFTVSGVVPIVGGYLSQGFDIIMASSVLIKNAVGLTGIFLLLGIVLAPIVKVVVFSLAIRLASAVTQPVADSRISNFLNSINKCFSMLTATLIGAGFMYFVTLALFISTGGYI
jgi:stage III sporulation protein AE